MVGRVLCCKGVVTNVLGGFLLSSTTLLTPWLASFVCSYWVSSTSCTYMPWSLQVFKCEKFPDIYSRSEYKVTLRTRKRVKQMFFFYFFFLFSETQSVLGWCSTKECTYTYLSMYIWVESTMSSLISVLQILFFFINHPPSLYVFWSLDLLESDPRNSFVVRW